MILLFSNGNLSKFIQKPRSTSFKYEETPFIYSKENDKWFKDIDYINIGLALWVFTKYFLNSIWWIPSIIKFEFTPT